MEFEDDDLINISDEPEAALATAEPWVVICADDDVSAHRSTDFALQGEIIEGRPVRLVSGYSAAEAIALVESNPDASVLLLDVVMETATAGLDAIAVIREKLGRRTLRIIVRSGAPGNLNELETVKKFDITDWRPKNELNQTRLLSAITLAVRAYEELEELERRGAGMDMAMMFLERLAKDPGSDELMRDLLGAIEPCLDASVWALARSTDGNWSLSCGPLEWIGDDFPMAGGETRGQGEGQIQRVEAWLLANGRCRRALGAAEVSGQTVSCEVWTPNAVSEEAWGAEQSRALLRALSSAVAGQEKARMDREALLLDSATGLLTRQGFIHRAAHALFKGLLGEDHAVFLIDLAGFAKVNSALGHEAGDEILKAAGARVREFAGDHLAARIGSDAFAVLMPKAEYSASKLEKGFDEPLATTGFPIPMKPRVSAALIDLEEPVGAWLTSAAAAMEQAKTATVSGGEARWFDPRSKALAVERMALSQKLFNALRDKRGMFMVFQPQIDMRTNAITGCEALIRWRDEAGVYIPPDKFIPLAEQSGLAMSISEFALSESLGMMRRAREAGLALPKVSVNISPVEFETGDLRARIIRHLAEQGCRPSDLMVEITETAAAKEPERMVHILNGLREEGVHVAIDDFGSGYSSLAQLSRLPIDELKIDRAFVNALGQPGPFSGIAKMISDLAASMQLVVVAEGVERHEQVELLVALGAHTAQGWLYAKGMPEAEFFAWVRANAEGLRAD